MIKAAPESSTWLKTVVLPLLSCSLYLLYPQWASCDTVMLDMLVNQDAREISSISGECDRQTDRMTCRFIQVHMDQALSEKEREDWVSLRVGQLRDEIKKSNPVTRCEPTMASGSEMKESALAKAWSAEAEYQHELDRRTKTACGDPSEVNLRELAEWMVEGQELTCNIAIYRPYQVVFELQGERQWAATTAPQGPCGVQIVSTLEKEETFSLWTYSVSRIITAPDGDKDTPEPFRACNKFETEQVTVFSSSKVDYLRKCSKVHFGA